jgi:hypothetical protein
MGAWWGIRGDFVSLFGLFKPVDGHFDGPSLVGVIWRHEGHRQAFFSSESVLCCCVHRAFTLAPTLLQD